MVIDVVSFDLLVGSMNFLLFFFFFSRSMYVIIFKLNMMFRIEYRIRWDRFCGIKYHVNYNYENFDCVWCNLRQ